MLLFFLLTQQPRSGWEWRRVRKLWKALLSRIKIIDDVWNRVQFTSSSKNPRGPLSLPEVVRRCKDILWLFLMLPLSEILFLNTKKMLINMRIFPQHLVNSLTLTEHITPKPLLYYQKSCHLGNGREGTWGYKPLNGNVLMCEGVATKVWMMSTHFFGRHYYFGFLLESCFDWQGRVHVFQ